MCSGKATARVTRGGLLSCMDEAQQVLVWFGSDSMHVSYLLC